MRGLRSSKSKCTATGPCMSDVGNPCHPGCATAASFQHQLRAIASAPYPFKALRVQKYCMRLLTLVTRKAISRYSNALHTRRSQRSQIVHSPKIQRSALRDGYQYIPDIERRVFTRADSKRPLQKRHDLWRRRLILMRQLRYGGKLVPPSAFRRRKERRNQDQLST